MIEHLSMRRGCVGPSDQPSADNGISQPCCWTGEGRQLYELVWIPGESSLYAIILFKIDNCDPLQSWRCTIVSHPTIEESLSSSLCSYTSEGNCFWPPCEPVNASQQIGESS